MKVLIIFMFFIQTMNCEYDKRVITTLKYSQYNVTPSIVNGKPAVEGQVPYLVSFKEPIKKIEPNRRVWRNLCGGSIIDSNRVLTAAHCFEGNKFYYTKHPQILRVVAGALNNDLIHTGDTETTDKVQWRRIKKVVLHEHFNFPNNDIAIAFVNEPWVYSKRVRNIRIAKRRSDYPQQCISAGYGRIGHRLKDNISPILLTARIKPMASWRCSQAWEMNMNSFICTESKISDVARGDSGGPLACRRTGDPNEVNEDGVLVGIVSGKNYDRTTLYTRVSAYNKWITGGVDKLCVHVYLAIIPFILIYLLFNYLQVVGSSIHILRLCSVI